MLNIVGLILAILGTWQYPRKYTGAFVLGNLVAAILARNELFGRLLYSLTNMLFAKVCIGVLGHRSDVSHVLKNRSGHPCGSVSAVLLSSNTLAASIRAAPHLLLRG